MPFWILWEHCTKLYVVFCGKKSCCLSVQWMMSNPFLFWSDWQDWIFVRLSTFWYTRCNYTIWEGKIFWTRIFLSWIFLILDLRNFTEAHRLCNTWLWPCARGRKASIEEEREDGKWKKRASSWFLILEDFSTFSAQIIIWRTSRSLIRGAWIVGSFEGHSFTRRLMIRNSRRSEAKAWRNWWNGEVDVDDGSELRRCPRPYDRGTGVGTTHDAR